VAALRDVLTDWKKRRGGRPLQCSGLGFVGGRSRGPFLQHYDLLIGCLEAGDDAA
jgi:hypothetical protein